MIRDVIERQQVESRNTIKFLKYTLSKRTPKDLIGNDGYILELSAWNSNSMMSIETASFNAPGRKKLHERHKYVFQDTYYKTPAEYIKNKMKSEFKTTKVGKLNPGRGMHRTLNQYDFCELNTNSNHELL